VPFGDLFCNVPPRKTAIGRLSIAPRDFRIDQAKGFLNRTITIVTRRDYESGEGITETEESAMNCYILAWSPAYHAPPTTNALVSIRPPTLVNRQQILDQLDKIPEVMNWRASTGAIFIASESSANDLSTKIHAALPTLIFVLSQINHHTTQGYSDKETWEFIIQPRGREQS
jgi:hypothetical protein